MRLQASRLAVLACALAFLSGCGGSTGGGGVGGSTPTPPSTPTAVAATRVFVANETPNQTGIPEFSVAAGASAAPINVIEPVEQNEVISGVASDTSGNLYVAENLTIYKYSIASSGASTLVGNVGAPGLLPGTNAITVDSTGQVYVASTSGSIVIFPAGATASTAPVRTISGAATGLNQPVALAVDSAQNLYVSDCSNGSCFIAVFSPTANGNEAPVRSITGLADGGNGLLFGSLTPVTVDRSGNLYFSIELNGSGYVYEVPSSTSGLIGNTTRILGGPNAGALGFGAITVDEVGNVFVNAVIGPISKPQLAVMSFSPTAMSDSPATTTITSSYFGNKFNYVAVQ